MRLRDNRGFGSARNRAYIYRTADGRGLRMEHLSNISFILLAFFAVVLIGAFIVHGRMFPDNGKKKH